MPALTRDPVDFSTSLLTPTCASHPSRFSITEIVHLSIKITLGTSSSKQLIEATNELFDMRISNFIDKSGLQSNGCEPQGPNQGLSLLMIEEVAGQHLTHEQTTQGQGDRCVGGRFRRPRLGQRKSSCRSIRARRSK